MTSRNFILFVCLMLFLVGYVSHWAYQSLYKLPREQLGSEIAKLSGEIETGKGNLARMTHVVEQTKNYYYRSLPQVQNEAQSRYSIWLLESLQHSGFELPRVADSPPVRTALRTDYRFTIQCTGSLAQLSRFLFEFYSAPFLHRITTMTLTPIEGNAEKLSLTMTVNVLALRPHKPGDPYPMLDQIPTGWWIQRLVTNDFSAYQTIASRNLLQTARGGIDRADYTILTGLTQVGDQKEAWFTDKSDDSVKKLKSGDSIHAGSFSGKIVEFIGHQDIVLERDDGSRWLLTDGENLNEAFALPPETVER